MNDRVNDPQPERNNQALEELKAIRRELAAMRKLVDTAIGVFFNAKFPFGQPDDRWRRRRP